MRKRYYFDYAASTPVDPRVERVMRPYWSKIFGNPGALHWYGQEASAVVFKARDMIAKSLGCDYKEIVFTGSATEANNLALRGVVKMVQQFSAGTAVLSLQRREPATPRSEIFASRKPSISELRSFRTKIAEPFLPKIIVSSIEHDSVLDTAKDLERDGVEVVYLPVSKDGIVDLKKLKDLLDERTILVSVMYVNNETGTIQPITEISKIIRNFREIESKKRQVKSGGDENNLFSSTFHLPLFHTDAVQAFNYLNCNVEELGVDLLTLSAQKIYGPKGVGLLYVKNLRPMPYILRPIITGGSQEYGLRSGTENVPGIVGFGKAAEIADKMRDKENNRLKKLQDYFLKRIKKLIPKVQLNGDLKNRLPNNINMYIPGAVGQDLIIKLDLAGFAVSPGAACSARICSPSHVLKAIGYSDERATNSIRITLGRYTNKKDIDLLLRAVASIIL